MGIKNLKEILQKCQSAITTRDLNNYSGLVLGIDLSIYLYKYLYNNNDHLEGLTRFVLRLLKNNITPVFIFDGKPPKEKSNILAERREKRNFMSNRRDLIDNCINFPKNNFHTFKEEVLKYTSEKGDIIEEEEIKNLFDKSEDDLQCESDKLNKRIIYV